MVFIYKIAKDGLPIIDVKFYYNPNYPAGGRVVTCSFPVLKIITIYFRTAI